MKQSLGLLEVSGLALAITCADAMAKAAAITLLALEKTNGSGWMVVKIAGDVASVQAAVMTGAELAERQQGWWRRRLSPGPAQACCQPASKRLHQHLTLLWKRRTPP